MKVVTKKLQNHEERRRLYKEETFNGVIIIFITFINLFFKPYILGIIIILVLFLNVLILI